VALQVCAVFVSCHLSRPGAVRVPGRLRDVIHRRCPGVVVLLVVLGAERLKHELGGLETARDLEVGWNAACMEATGESFDALGARVANTFSGGELKRILLEALFRSNAEVLLLDEPDNFLDVLGKEWLEATMSASRKTILYVSHDREFLAGLSNRVLELGPDGATVYGGGYREYVERSGHEAPGLR